MADDLVEIKSIIRKVDGHLIEARYISGKLVSIGSAPFYLMEDYEPWPWDRMGEPLTHRVMLPLDLRNIVYTSPRTALVKEGPKEMVIWKP